MFPENFVWGASTSSYQIEGAVESDGRGKSIGIAFRIAGTGEERRYWRCRLRPLSSLAGRSRSARARPFHRLSILDRVAAHPAGGQRRVEPRGLDFYDRLVDGLVGARHHAVAVPLSLGLAAGAPGSGRLANRDIGEKFANYARVVAKRLGDRVKRWVTFNEPNIHALFGHGMGEHAPGLKGLPNMLAAIHHQNFAQGRARPGAARGTLRPLASVRWSHCSRRGRPPTATKRSPRGRTFRCDVERRLRRSIAEGRLSGAGRG